MFEKIDVVTVVIKSCNTEAVVGYVRLSDGTNFLRMISCLDAAKTAAAETSSKVQLLWEISDHGMRPRVTLLLKDMENFCWFFAVVRALLCHLPTNLHFSKAVSLVEVLLTCVCANLHCVIYSLLQLLIKKSNTLLVACWWSLTILLWTEHHQTPNLLWILTSFNSCKRGLSAFYFGGGG